MVDVCVCLFGESGQGVSVWRAGDGAQGGRYVCVCVCLFLWCVSEHPSTQGTLTNFVFIKLGPLALAMISILEGYRALIQLPLLVSYCSPSHP